ncbi:hypothetical protein CVT24_001543 [Panaeolus cyanescens]|uniref:Peptidase S9 prolyl oligopeptidase catalytic domain-containing protein n=1 Tax=Panaeolus cyanescens TaxID=181874 RepID=A0A409W2W5_9AGAR|nr:hypothetical protein CVT24_001543 [Panaeolus cyanescens]
MAQAPYGTWKSPITAEAITKDANGIADLLVDSVTGKVYHLERRASEEGRNVIVDTGTNKDVFGAGWNARTMVQEYGGASAIVHGGIAYFSHHPEGRLYKVPVDGSAEPEAVTRGEWIVHKNPCRIFSLTDFVYFADDAPYRFACMEAHPIHPQFLVSVLEDHTVDTPADIITSLVIIDTNKKTIHPVLAGADFYSYPTFSPDGKHLAWQQWYHPDMPWEGSLVYVGDVVLDDDHIQINKATYVAGVQEKISAQFARWIDNDSFVYTSDESDFMNPWKYSVSSGKSVPIFPSPVQQDFGSPTWFLENFPCTILDNGRTGLFTGWKDGRNGLYLVDLQGGMPEEIKSPFTSIGKVLTVSRDNSSAVFIGEKATEGTSIVQWTRTSGVHGRFDVLKAAEMVTVGGVPLSVDIISPPQPINLTLPENITLPVVYYAPRNPEYWSSNIPGEKPPCVLNVHGGPTHLTTQALNWDKQFFTSRGWAWVDVNYGGSSGYGRKFIERLRGKWGIVDVEDSIFAAKALSTAPYNLIDPNRVMIRGMSAGGYTTLASISLPADKSVFAGATSFFGICDLKKCTETIHKYELRYLEKLIGGTFEEVPHIYKSQSPLFHADKIVTPLLILQGEIDMVVTQDQADMIYKSVKSGGGVVDIKIYPNEGHGWRKESSLKDSLERELGFYEKVLKLKA